jgi:hypothetical protein
MKRLLVVLAVIGLMLAVAMFVRAGMNEPMACFPDGPAICG